MRKFRKMKVSVALAAAVITIILFVPSMLAAANLNYQFLPGSNYTQGDTKATLHTSGFNGPPYPVRVDWIDPNGNTVPSCNDEIGLCGVSYDQQVADNGVLVWRNFYFYIYGQQRPSGTYTAIAYSYQSDLHIYSEMFRATFTLSGTTPTPGPTTQCYVNASASGANNGSSWPDAFTDLQSALGTSPCTEIWVAGGIYKPTAGTNGNATFQLKNGVALYGGFAGTETGRDQRNPATNVTILSGDIDNNDSQKPIITDLNTVIGNTTNSIHVVTGATGATLDGFTITAGNAGGSSYQGNGGGGGMFNNSSNPILNDVTFIGNLAYAVGGGMSNMYSSPIMTNVTFNGNSAGYGGGMFNYHSSPTLTDGTFNGNSAIYYGFANVGSLDGDGGGMDNSSSSPTLTNVTFSGNSTFYAGGGMENISSSPALTNVTFSGNTADNGGGMDNYSSSNPKISNTIFWANTASSGAQINNDSSSTPSVSDSVIQDGYAGTNIIPADPLLGTLGNNGGFTQTIPLLAGSSAIDAGNDGVCPPTDQRGVIRPQGAHCDIGAYELYVDTTAPVVEPFTVTSPSNSLDISITAFEATDDVGVTGYLITESATIPEAGAGGWTGSGPTTFTVVSDGTYTLYPWAKDAAGNVSAVFATPRTVVVDTTPPTVVLSVRANPSPTSALSVNFTVTFSEPVTGVDKDDFSLTATGVSGASVSGVSGSGNVYTVAVNTGSGNGSIRLEVPTSATITDLAGNLLTDLAYTGGETYTINKKFNTYLPLIVR